jgi:hypothetical protein
VSTSTKREAVVPKNHNQRRRVFSKLAKKREKGAPKPGISFRSPEDVVEWLERMKSEGHDQTDVIVTALRVSRDVASRIGDRWYEIEYRAQKRRMEPGEMLAELALAAITAEDRVAFVESPSTEIQQPASSNKNQKK